MKIFISWSGPLSLRVAEVLRDWLPLVFDSATPFVSTEDIAKGENWNARLSAELSSYSFGLILVTRENSISPWLHFEAGALSRSLPSLGVSPILVDLGAEDLTGPLKQFQFTTFEKQDLRRLLAAVNGARGEDRLDESVLDRRFEFAFPDLLARLDDIRQDNRLAAERDAAAGATDHSLATQFFSESYVNNSGDFQRAMGSCCGLDMLGYGHNRMSTAYADNLTQLLDRGGNLRVIALDPNSPAVIEANRRSSTPKGEAEVRHQHLAALALLRAIGERAVDPSGLEIRTIDFAPPFTLYGFEMPDPAEAECFIWLTPWRLPSSSRPGFSVSRGDSRRWYEFFKDQFEEIWDVAESAVRHD